MNADEIRIVLAAHLIDHEAKGPTSFTIARDFADADIYASEIVAQVEQRSALWAACDDVAASIGECDYDEATLAVEAIGRQWEHVADLLEPTDPTAVRVRMAAAELNTYLQRDDWDVELLPDLITVCVIEDDLRNHAAGLSMADKDGQGADYLRAHGEEIERAFRFLVALKDDLRGRGELALDDEVLPSSEPDGDVPPAS